MHAAEASLSQLLNLLIAFFLLRGFGIGRVSAVGSMTAKLVSFVMVTLGLFLCTLEDGKPPSAAGAAAGAVVAQGSSTAPLPLPGNVPGFDTASVTGIDAAAVTDAGLFGGGGADGAAYGAGGRMTF
mgnify:CR=1 FL=1